MMKYTEEDADIEDVVAGGSTPAESSLVTQGEVDE